MDKVDYYKTLGIDKNATDREIKKSYRKLAMRYHPDRNPGNKQAENKFKEVKEAYEILIDPKKKSAYDQFGHSAFNQNNESHQDAEFASSFSHTTDFGDIFGDVFGDIFGQKNNSKSYDQRGSDLQYLMEITLEQAVKGAKKEITIPTLQSCNFCHGKGFPLGSKLETCTTCQGTGQLHTRQSFFTVQQTCPHCQGKGRKITNPCYVCKGTGRTKKSKKLSIKIPAGINNNDSIRLIEKGEAGKNGGPSGDLYIKIKIKKHPIFKRKENNLYCVVPIDFSTAALGGKICIPTLDKKIILKIPSETQSGKLFRIKGKGVKSIKNREIGDLLCQIIVETPINLNKKQKDLLIELQNSLSGLNKKKNNPKSKKFFSRVKNFFENLTK